MAEPLPPPESDDLRKIDRTPEELAAALEKRALEQDQDDRFWRRRRRTMMVVILAIGILGPALATFGLSFLDIWSMADWWRNGGWQLMASTCALGAIATVATLARGWSELGGFLVFAAAFAVDARVQGWIQGDPTLHLGGGRTPSLVVGYALWLSAFLIAGFLVGHLARREREG
jgi:peptidoglycan/LPS O-acetylase OafA/YrhL